MEEEIRPPELSKPEEAMQYAQPSLHGLTKLCLRPNYGTLGDTVTLLANYYRIHTEEGFYCYYIRMRQSTQQEFRVFPLRLACALLNAIALDKDWENETWKFDGQNCLFTRPDALFGREKNQTIEEEIVLHDIKFTIEVQYKGRAKFEDFRKYIQDSGKKYPAQALQALQIAINSKLIMDPNCQRVGASFFQQAQRQQIVDLGKGAELWFGFKQPVKVCQQGAFLTLDTTASAFVKQIYLHEFIFEILQNYIEDRTPKFFLGCTLFQKEIEYIQEKIQGLKVETEYNGGRNPKRNYKIYGIGIPPRDFWIEDLKLNVEQYLFTIYGEAARIHFPRLPCVIVNRKGNQIPMELCRIKAGQKRIRLDDAQKSIMTKKSTQNPLKRMQQSNQRANNISNYLSQYPHLGLQLDKQMIQVPGRVLQPPKLEYKEGSHQPYTGEWSVHQEFKHPAQINSWAVVCFAQAEDVDFPGCGLSFFLNTLIGVMRSRGMYNHQSSVQSPGVHFVNDRSLESIPRHLEEGMQMAQQQFHRPADFLLLVLPFKSNELYRRIKLKGLFELGVQTQCMLIPNAGIGQPHMIRKIDKYCENIVMKINSKLNGVNQQLADQQLLRHARILPNLMRNVPYIVIGADISHPPPGKIGVPSVAAVVSTWNRYCDRYSASISRQTCLEERVLNLREMVKLQLLNFFQKTHRKPEMIIYYRNGIVQGKLYNSLIYEYDQIRQACYEMGDPAAKYCPPITFINVTKRHNTRLYPHSGHDLDTKSGNVAPGTVVDKAICHPHQFDFFMVSQIGIQGTSRPVHYHVLRDENGLGADNLQEMTYFLCYTCARCQRSITMVPPIYYASICAEKGMLLSMGEQWDEEVTSEVMQIHDNLVQDMWFI